MHASQQGMLCWKLVVSFSIWLPTQKLKLKHEWEQKLQQPKYLSVFARIPTRTSYTIYYVVINIINVKTVFHFVHMSICLHISRECNSCQLFFLLFTQRQRSVTQCSLDSHMEYPTLGITWWILLDKSKSYHFLSQWIFIAF